MSGIIKGAAHDYVAREHRLGKPRTREKVCLGMFHIYSWAKWSQATQLILSLQWAGPG